MQFFRDAHSVRLLAHTGKYLWADEDKKSVAQRRGRDAYGAIWRVELVADKNAVRFKSVYDLYLMASDYAFLLGATGKKVLQSFASKADSALEWEPVEAGTFVKLKTKGDKFLRANGGMPPYRNSVTHDVPVLASNQPVVLWEVEVVRKRDAPSTHFLPLRQSSASSPSPQLQAENSEGETPSVRSEDEEEEIPAPPPRSVHRPRRRDEDEESPVSSEPGSPRRPPSEALRNTRIGRRRGSPPRDASYYPPSYEQSPPPGRQSYYPPAPALVDYATLEGSGRESLYPPVAAPAPARRVPEEYDSSPRGSVDGAEGSGRGGRGDLRRIFYSVAEEDGEVLALDDETYGTFMFGGQSLDELTRELQRVTGLREDIILCMRNPLSAKLYKMRLALPQNTAPLSVVVVRSNSQFGRTFPVQTSPQR